MSEQELASNKKYKQNKLKTIVGCLLVQFSSGIIPIWGNANLYFLSYFKNHGQQINKDTNSWVLISIVLPMCVCIVFSTKLCNYFGFTRVLKSCSLIFFLSHLIIYLKFSMVICTIFLFTIPITVISISFVPLYNCLWEYYSQIKSTVTGYALVCYGVGGSLFNVVFLNIANPQNFSANMVDQDGFVYFGTQVTQNVQLTTKVIFLTVSIIFIIGAMLIHKQSQEYRIQEDNGYHAELKQQFQFNIEQIKQDKNIDNEMITPQSLIDKKDKDIENGIQKRQQKLQLKKYLLDWKFILIFVNVLLLDFYIAFLLNNFKLIFIPTINDDHFLGYCLVANTITAILGTFLWGCLGDILGFGKTMLALVLLDTIIKIIGVFSTNKVTLFLLMVGLGFTSRGMSTISGPGIIQLFGLKIGTELLPIKALAVIGSFICVPILQLIFLNFVTPFQFMNCLITVNFFIILSTLYFIKRRKQQQQSQRLQ